MGKPLVSIITPCYNGENFLERYFESVLAQTYSELELIFVNDGSTDKTEEIALSYESKFREKGIRYKYIKQENRGQAAALNSGLKLFQGDYLTWPDSDDRMLPNCIEKKVEFLEKNLQYDLCICQISIINEENEAENRIGERKKPKGEDHFFEDILFFRDIFFVPGGYMVRSKALLSIIPDREIYSGRGGQNCQIILPMVYYFKCGYIEEVLFEYYIRDNSHSHSISNSLEIIKQLQLYETILIETIKRMDKELLDKYEKPIKTYYARLRYGNAIDTNDKKVIKKYYHELSMFSKTTMKEKLIYAKKMLEI